MENITTIEQMENLYPILFRARGLDRLKTRINNLKAEIAKPYAKKRGLFVDLGRYNRRKP